MLQVELHMVLVPCNQQQYVSCFVLLHLLPCTLDLGVLAARSKRSPCLRMFPAPASPSFLGLLPLQTLSSKPSPWRGGQ